MNFRLFHYIKSYCGRIRIAFNSAGDKKAVSIKLGYLAGLVILIACSVNRAAICGDNEKVAASQGRNDRVGARGILMNNSCLNDQEIEQLTQGEISMTLDGHYITTHGVTFERIGNCWAPLINFEE